MGKFSFMKRNIILFVILALMCSCTSSINKPDKRDKYVGEYKLHEKSEWWGEDQSYEWDYYTNSYGMRYYQNSSSDSTHTLVVTKSPYDTISLKFDIVAPFDFENQKRIIALNEEIKKRNEESICGKDEELHKVPEPTYSNDRVLVESFSAYVDGHKIFICDYKKGDDYKGSGYKEEVTFDSVYLLNDTMHFIQISHADFFYKYDKTGWRTSKRWYCGIKRSEN